MTTDEILAHFDARFTDLREYVALRFSNLEDREQRNHESAIHRLDTLGAKVDATNGRVSKLEMDQTVAAALEAEHSRVEEEKGEDPRSRAQIAVARYGLWALVLVAAITGVTNIIIDHF